MAQYDTTPWQYRLKPEDWKNLSPGAGVANVANAMVGGLNTYNQSKMNQLAIQQKQMALANKPIYDSKTMQPIGEVPANSEFAPQQPTPGAVYNIGSSGTSEPVMTTDPVTGVKKPLEVNKKTDTVHFQSGMQGINSQDITKDPSWQDRARRAASGTEPSESIRATAARYPGQQTQFYNMINKASMEDWGVPFDLEELVKREKFDRDVSNQRLVVFDQAARNTIDDLMGHLKEAKRTQIPFLDKYVASGAISLGGVPYQDVESIKGILVEEVAKVVSGGNAITNDALELSKKIVGDWNSDDQFKSSLQRVKERLDNKTELFKEAGVKGGFGKKEKPVKNNAQNDDPLGILK